MKKSAFLIMVMSLFLLTGCRDKEAVSTSTASSLISTYNTTMKRDILSLMLAYPEYVLNVEQKNSKVYLVMKSGNRILYDDKKAKSYEEKFNNADIQDMMWQIYPVWDIKNLMPQEFDPGRFRVYALLQEV